MKSPYKSGMVFMIFLLFFSSCFNPNMDCIEEYLAADEWMIEKTGLAGDNEVAKDHIYEAYLDRYDEINSRCNSNKNLLPRL